MSDYRESDASHGAQAALDVAVLLDELVATVERAKSMPLSASVIVPKDELLGLLHQAVEALPIELAHARHVLKDQDGVIDRANRDAEQLLDEARAQAAHMVERTEVVRQARYKAERLIADADSEARRARLEADDYVDRKLAAFEIVLDRTMRTVASGRERLSVPTVADNVEDGAESDEEIEQGFFDQDRH